MFTLGTRVCILASYIVICLLMCSGNCQATAQLKQAFKDPAIIPALCAVMTGSLKPQVGSDLAFFVLPHFDKR